MKNARYECPLDQPLDSYSRQWGTCCTSNSSAVILLLPFMYFFLADIFLVATVCNPMPRQILIVVQYVTISLWSQKNAVDDHQQPFPFYIRVDDSLAPFAMHSFDGRQGVGQLPVQNRTRSSTVDTDVRILTGDVTVAAVVVVTIFDNTVVSPLFRLRLFPTFDPCLHCTILKIII